jgi:hypothetical protein
VPVKLTLLDDDQYVRVLRAYDDALDWAPDDPASTISPAPHWRRPCESRFDDLTAERLDELGPVAAPPRAMSAGLIGSLGLAPW